MVRYSAKRFAQGLLTIFLVVSAVFVLIRLAPGDPAMRMASRTATTEEIAEIRRSLGLDEPLFTQYWIFLRDLIQGDLGESFSYGRPAFEVVVERLPYTLLLAVAVVVVTALVAVPLGIFTARRSGKPSDTSVNILTMVGQSMPDFWLGIMLIVIFAVTIPIFPTSGTQGPLSIVLPTLTIVTLQVALISRVMRREMMSNLGAPYAVVARARGVPERTIVWNHAVKNAAIPVVTALGTRFAAMVNGVVLVEVVFAWPGVGSLVVRALQTNDYPLIVATVLVTSTVAIVVQLLVDLLYPLLDPRVRLFHGASR